MGSIEPIQEFFLDLHYEEHKKNALPPFAPPVSRAGRGTINDALVLPVSGANRVTGNTALSQPGDARAAGAEACRSPQERQ
jgi:hypothetical protein